MAEKSGSETPTYEEAKAYLKTAFEHIISAGRDVGELVEFAFEKSGDALAPYLRRFLSDVHEGRIKIQGLTDSARMAVLGRHITAEERQAMIREAAYLRAERRGFVGGSPEEDWLLAEQETDERLLQQSGLVSKGRRAVTSATRSVERELGSMQEVITRWLEGKGDMAKRSKPTKTAKLMTGKKKSTPEKKKKAPVKKTAARKTKTAKAKTKKVASKKKTKAKQSTRDD